MELSFAAFWSSFGFPSLQTKHGGKKRSADERSAVRRSFWGGTSCCCRIRSGERERPAKACMQMRAKPVSRARARQQLTHPMRTKLALQKWKEKAKRARSPPLSPLGSAFGGAVARRTLSAPNRSCCTLATHCPRLRGVYRSRTQSWPLHPLRVRYRSCLRSARKCIFSTAPPRTASPIKEEMFVSVCDSTRTDSDDNERSQRCAEQRLESKTSIAASLANRGGNLIFLR